MRILCHCLLLLALVVTPLLLPSTTSAAPTRVWRWGYVVKEDTTSLASLRANVGKLDYVSPNYFEVHGDGTIQGSDKSEVSDLVRRSGARLVPMVQNKDRYSDFAGVLNNADVRRRVVASLADLAQTYRYDGLHIDFEGLNPTDRLGLNQFMADLSVALRAKGKLTTMALGAKPEDKDSGWAGVYDYAALGRSVDLAVVMAYGYRTARSSVPGSTSPLGWVRDCAAFAASQIPANKLLLGVGLWGYDWNTSAGGAAQVRTHPEVLALASRWGGKLGYDYPQGSAWLEYYNNAQRHVVWYEDGRSLEAKIKVAMDLQMAGFAAWRLGHEGEEAWRLFDSYNRSPGPANWSIPNGHFFTQTNGYPSGLSSEGYSVTNEGGVRFWDEFQRLGGVGGVGYPLSQRFVWDGFVTQVMQKGIFQWRPEANRVYFINIFDELHDDGYDDWLLNFRSTPRPLDGSFDAGKSWPQIVSDRLALLDANPAIKEKFWSAPDGIFQYGLPVSRVADNGNHFAIRLQRAVMQQWKVEVPWARVGQVTVANGGAVAVEARMFAPEITATEFPPGS